MKYIIYSFIAFSVASLFAAGLSNFATSEHQNLIWIMLTVIFLIQWIGFIIANALKTEKFYDITGTLTYLLVVWGASFYSSFENIVANIVSILVTIWSVRLGSYLFFRIKKDGEDKRFREIKNDPACFFMTWTLQGLWVFLTLLSSQAIFISSQNTKLTNPFIITGIIIWLVGFSIEVISDKQKKEFRENEKNKGQFISTGLWAYSRHPNYVGEITLWLGITIMSLPSLSGWGYIALISPIFVYWLLAKISGVPMLEESALKRWGHEKSYMDYIEKTPVLFPKLFK